MARFALLLREAVRSPAGDSSAPGHQTTSMTGKGVPHGGKSDAAAGPVRLIAVVRTPPGGKRGRVYERPERTGRTS